MRACVRACARACVLGGGGGGGGTLSASIAIATGETKNTRINLNAINGTC